MKKFIHHDFAKLERDTSENGTRVYLTPTGKKYPSVTTVTSLHNIEGIMKWRRRVGEEEANRVSAKASARGTRIHTLCEKFLLGEEIAPDICKLLELLTVSLIFKESYLSLILRQPLNQKTEMTSTTTSCKQLHML